jgi:hypothetical protein
VTEDDMLTDHWLEVLRRMPIGDVDAASAARIRGRCQAVLRRRGRRAGLREAGSRWSRRVLEPGLVALVCAAYLSEVVRRGLALLGP